MTEQSTRFKSEINIGPINQVFHLCAQHLLNFGKIKQHSLDLVCALTWNTKWSLNLINFSQDYC